MRTLRFALFAAVLSTAVFSIDALAQVRVSDAWVRATVKEQTATGAFMKLTAPSKARLISVSSPVADITEIHEMAVIDNVMKMREVSALELPAGRQVELKPGGLHVMLMDLKGPLNEGDSVPLVLTIESGGKRTTQQVTATVRKLTAR